MIKVAIFTEGQSELIFTRELLLRFIFNYQNISIMCLELHNSDLHHVPYDIETCNPIIYFQIVDVGTDNKVSSYIKDRIQNLVSEGFEFIFGLRDIFPGENSNLSHSVESKLVNSFIEKQRSALSDITKNSKQVKLFFAIMEFEAWILSMPNLFKKINPILSVDYINEKLGFDLSNVDPQTAFYHPSNEVKCIYKLIGENYKKSSRQIEKIMNKMDADDILEALSNNKCLSLQEYHTEFLNLYQSNVLKTT